MGNLKNRRFRAEHALCGCANNVEKDSSQVGGRCRCFGQLWLPIHCLSPETDKLTPGEIQCCRTGCGL